MKNYAAAGTFARDGIFSQELSAGDDLHLMMLTEEKYAEIISAIYETALDVEQWPKALELLAEALDATGGCLLRQNLATGEGSMFNVRSDPKFGQLYNDHYHKLNILPQRAAGRPLGSCVTDRMIVPKLEFVKSEFYNDYLRRFKVQGVLKAYVFAEGDWEGYVSFGSRSTGSDWESEHVEFLNSIAPHLHRATQINLRLQSSRLVHVGALQVLESLAQGVIILDHLSQPIFLNRAAEAMTRAADGIAIKDRCLEAAKRSETVLLQRMVDSVIHGKVQTATGGTLLISRPSRRGCYSLLIAPLPASTVWHLPKRRGALIFIRDPEQNNRVSEGTYLREVYDLTPAETAITMELMCGGGLRAGADRLGIALSTARSHLKSVFAKLDVHSQVDLVRLVAQLRAGE